MELENGFKITGILHTFNDNFSDSVVSESEEILFGKRDLEEEILGLKFKISPYSFFQTNSKTVEKLYEKVLDYLDEIEGKIFTIQLYLIYSVEQGQLGKSFQKRQSRFMGLSLWKRLLKKQMKMQN